MPSEHAPPERLVWTPELVARFWDGVAHTALDAQSFARIAGPLVILAARSHFTPGGRHLDFGAGDGTLTRLMIEAGFPTAACEPAPERRAVLERRLAGLDGFLGAEAEAHAPYDAVLMAEVIEHVLDRDLDPVLRTVHGFLRPGGRLVITTPHAEDLDASMVYCPVSNTLFHRWQHVRSLTPESLAALLAPRGFRVIVTHLVEFSNLGFLLPPERLRLPWPVGPLWRRLRTAQLARRFASGRPVRLGNRSHMVCVAERL
ncbi:MAG: hypothetical protein BroJett026_40840 [Betaproteobacteria bacterium]|nr:MAG: hypothetical protein BroJett026_40840 [Betaproteobacteria bacterium]